MTGLLQKICAGHKNTHCPKWSGRGPSGLRPFDAKGVKATYYGIGKCQEAPSQRSQSIRATIHKTYPIPADGDPLGAHWNSPHDDH